MANPRRRLTLLVIGWILVQACFLPTAFRIDETNIIAIAKQIAREPLDPYGFEINWLGSTQPAFAILSNPPGVPAWLALVGRLFGWNETVLHLSVLPFSLLALVCTALLASRIGAPPFLTAAAMVCSPAFFLGSQVVMPDVAMLGSLVASVAAAVAYRDSGSRSAFVAAFVFGMLTPLLKYNGMILLPVLALLALTSTVRRGGLGLITISPLLGLGSWSLASLLIYGKNHFLEIARFQAQSESDILTGALAALGLGLLPLLVSFWRPRDTRTRKQELLVGAAGAAISLLIAVSMLDYTPGSSILFAFSCGLALGFLYRVAAVGMGAVAQRDRDTLLLFAWIAFGLAFQFGLMFTAVRYLLPILPAIVLVVLRSPAPVRKTWLTTVLAASFLLTLSVAIGDARTANVAREVVREQVAPLKNRLHGRLFFSGHWGFQFYAEQIGGEILEAGATPELRAGDVVVIALNAFPRITKLTLPAGLDAEHKPFRISPGWPVHTIDCDAAANFHGNAVGTCRYLGTVYLPFAFSTRRSERFEIITVRDSS